MLKPHAVFVVGAPRSGTKLLRSLLNNHLDISLGHEGNYIPTFVKRFGLDADLSQPSLRRKIYQEFSRTAAFPDIEAEHGVGFSEAAFMGMLASYDERGSPVTWSNVFEVLLRAPSPHPKARIYGDKSHGYIRAVALLRTVFEDARFILIVRDPRDQALSAMKTWGRNPLRSAHHWLFVVRRADHFGFDVLPDAITVRYEDLTHDAEKELQRICSFLQVPYQPEMTTLQKPAEKERRGRQLKIVTKQHAKYRGVLPATVVKVISEVTLPYLARYGYPNEGARKHRTFSPTRLRLLRFADGFASLRFHMREKGWLKGFLYYLKRHSESISARQSIEKT